MKIKYQIFLSILTASVAVAISVSLILDWTFLQRHRSSVKAINRERLENLAVGLKQIYVEHGNWDAVRTDPPLRARLLEATLHAAHPGARPKEGAVGDPEMPRPLPYGPNGRQFDNNVLLLDAGKDIVFGPLVRDEHVDFTPIIHQERTVGYVGLRPVGTIIDPRPRIRSTQQLSIILIAVAGLVISTGVSLLLAQRLLRPVKTLTSALHDLASGQLHTRVNLNNRSEVGQLARDFNLLALSLERNKKARCQYAADISHELSTPLTIMRGELEAILEGVRQASQDAIVSLYGEVLQLNRLVDDIYQLALSDIGALTYRKEMRSIAEILRQAVNSFRNDFAIKEVDLRVDIHEPNNEQIHADGDRIHQLFDNLLKNSLKYTDPGGMLDIRMECRDTLAIIEFQDSAPGIPADELQHLFNRFFRVERLRNRVTGGAGLGLTICKNIVEAHEGSINALHSPLGGLWIKIELPLARRDS